MHPSGGLAGIMTRRVHPSWVAGMVKKVKGGDIALNKSSSQRYGASPAVWDHTMLPATRHR